MSDAAAIAAAPTPATTAAPAPAAQPAAPAATQASLQATDPPVPKPGDVGTPEWLNPRLDQAKRAARADLLKELGTEDVAVAKKALDDAKTRADADKTASELAASEKTKRVKAETDLEIYRVALAAHADRQFATLTPAQQAFVEKTAGNDPPKRLAAIEDVRALMATVPSVAETKTEEKTEAKPPVVAPAEKKPLPAPASTAAGGASPGGQPSVPVDHLAALAYLDRTNPYAAGPYYQKHQRAIDSARAQKAAPATS